MTAPTTWNDRMLIDAEAARLAYRFPGVAVWFGAATRHWWALVRSAGRWRLVEAGGPHDLSQLIASTNADSLRSRDTRPAIAPDRSRVSRRRSRGRHTREYSARYQVSP